MAINGQHLGLTVSGIYFKAIIKTIIQLLEVHMVDQCEKFCFRCSCLFWYFCTETYLVPSISFVINCIETSTDTLGYDAYQMRLNPCPKWQHKPKPYSPGEVYWIQIKSTVYCHHFLFTCAPAMGCCLWCVGKGLQVKICAEYSRLKWCDNLTWMTQQTMHHDNSTHRAFSDADMPESTYAVLFQITVLNSTHRHADRLDWLSRKTVQHIQPQM